MLCVCEQPESSLLDEVIRTKISGAGLVLNIHTAHQTNQLSPFGIMITILSAWVKVFRINTEFRILRLTFHKKLALKC